MSAMLLFNSCNCGNIMTFHPSRSANLFLLTYFPFIAIAMIGFAIFCSYKQYHLNTDLSVQEVNNTYRDKGALLSFTVSLILVYFLGLEVEAYQEGYLYSGEFLNGDASFSLSTMLVLSFKEYAGALTWQLGFVLFWCCAYFILWLLFYLCAHPRSDDYDTRIWESVKEKIAPNPQFSRFYVLDARNGASPFITALALIIVLSGFYLFGLGKKEEHKFYTVDVQLSQSVLRALQDSCVNGSAQYRDGVLTCDSRKLHSIFMPSGHIYDVVVVWEDENSSKHEVLIRVPVSKAPPVNSPEEATKRVKQILNSINEPFIKAYNTSENRAAWEKLER